MASRNTHFTLIQDAPSFQDHWIATLAPFQDISNSTKIWPFQDQFSGSFIMASTNNTLQLEAPTLSFSTANQAKEWKTFYVRALNYLETLDITLDININTPDQTEKGGKQIKMMFMGKDWEVLHSLTVTPSHHRSSKGLSSSSMPYRQQSRKMSNSGTATVN